MSSSRFGLRDMSFSPFRHLLTNVGSVDITVTVMSTDPTTSCERVDLAFTGPPKITSVPKRFDSYSNPGGDLTRSLEVGVLPDGYPWRSFSGLVSGSSVLDPWKLAFLGWIPGSWFF
jgi:hypothetical protein